MTNEERRLYYKAWSAKNKIARQQYQKDWHSKNPAYRKKYREKNREEMNAYARRYNAINHEAYRKRQNDYMRQHPEKRKAEYARYRARLVKAEGSFTTKDWEQLKAAYQYLCFLCLRREPEIRLTADHKIPLSKGGSNYIDNIQPLCLSCNSRKKDSVWFAQCLIQNRDLVPLA